MTRTCVALVVVLLGSAPSKTAFSDNLDLPECLDQAGVVGIRDCPEFGEWGEPREEPYLFAAFGFTLRRLPRPPHARTTPAASALSATGTTTQPLPQPKDDGGASTSWGYTERLSVGLSSPLYLGGEVEIGFSELDEADPGDRKLCVGAVGLAGIRIGRGPFAIAGEIAGGGRVIETADGEEVGPEVEARVVADIFLTPWLTFGGELGTSLINDGDKMVGLYLGIHSYSYGSRW